ncbi:AbrB/MazE/SpoVT family DNA-binding domain-containing protein [Sphingomonas sp. Tas61C01]|uniref:AbrB/MazE/SpoVT family DNA-binding domain-containing protein n=1 Tax=Sphingomonas sp. Tas61C01 TaxID=3458297 RepID=UPI00403EC333
MGKQSRLTNEGLVAIPDDVREKLGLRPGDLVAFEQIDGTIHVVKGAEVEQPSFDDRLQRARALAVPFPLGMTTDEYMSMIREPLPPHRA